MQDAFRVALTVANCLPRLQVSLSLLREVPAFLKGADCSLWQAQRSHLLSPGEDHRNPHKRRLLWSTVASPGGSLVPSSTSLFVCPGQEGHSCSRAQLLTDSKGIEGSPQPAGSSAGEQAVAPPSMAAHRPARNGDPPPHWEIAQAAGKHC